MLPFFVTGFETDSCLFFQQLALKHRQNKNQRQRIIVLVCSPVKDSQAALVKVCASSSC